MILLASHPKPLSQCLLIFSNVILLGIGVAVLILYARVGTSSLSSLSIVHVLFGVALAAMVLSFVGCTGSRFFSFLF